MGSLTALLDIAALRIAIKPLNGASHRIDLVFPFRKAVSFICVVICINRSACLLENRYHLLCLLLRNTYIVITLQHQERRFLVPNIC